MLLLPSKDRARCELGAVVADDHAGLAADLDDAIELTGNANAGQRVVDDEGQAFAAEVIDHRQNAELSAAGERVRHEVQ